jgi:hypothetical protein
MKNKVDEISGHTIDKYKITHCRFGISQIKYIDKMLKIDNMQDLCFDLLNIPFTYSKFKIIVVGYNGSPNQQHFDIINSLSKYNWNDDLFIFPFTYGGTKLYRKKLEIMINKKELSYLFIDDYLSNEKIAALRVISDVLVQLQTTDALSASTQEHLYAGSRVIVGSWLPYSFLRDNGVIYETVDSVDEIGEYLNKTITNKISKYKKNHNNKIIRNLSSWDETINCWYSL